MNLYIANVEVDSRGLDDARIDAVMDQLEGYSPSLWESERGRVGATITLPGDSLTDATASALRIVSGAYGAQAITCEVDGPG